MFVPLGGGGPVQIPTAIVADGFGSRIIHAKAAEEFRAFTNADYRADSGLCGWKLDGR